MGRHATPPDSARSPSEHGESTRRAQADPGARGIRPSEYDSARPQTAHSDRTLSWASSGWSTPRDEGSRSPAERWKHGNIDNGRLSLVLNACWVNMDSNEKALDYDTDSTSSPSALPPVPQGLPPKPDALSTTREILFVFNVCLAQFLSLAALAQTVSPLLIIGKSLNVGNPGQLSWFTAAFSMTLGTFILPAGRLGDIFGHKRIFLLGWLWFAVWSLLAGFCYKFGPITFSIFRAFQGIGPALLVPNAMAMIGRTFPLGMKRNIVFSLFGACGPTGWTVGASMSAVFAQLVWWPYSFWALAIVCTITAGFSWLVIPPALAKRPGPPGSPSPPFDWLGGITGVSGLILVNFALNQAPLAGWSTPYVYFILMMGMLLVAFFIVVELKIAKSPLLPLKGLQPQAWFTLACIAAGWASHGIWIYYLNMFLMRIRHATPLLASAETSPVAATGVIFALSTGFLLKHVHVSTLMFLAMSVFFFGTTLLALMPAKQSYWSQTFVSVLLMPAGMNWSFPAGTILLSNAMPPEMQGKAASLVSTVVNYSIASGLGFAGSIERHVNPYGDLVIEGYRGAWYMGMGLSGFGMVIAAYFVLISRRQQVTEKVAR